MLNIFQHSKVNLSLANHTWLAVLQLKKLPSTKIQLKNVSDQPGIAAQLFTPLDMMDAPPFDEVLLVGLIAMVGNVLSHNIKEKYVTVRSAECAPVDRKGVPQDCR